MKRKLVKQGAATMMISLPSKWIKANSLEKGDEISLEEKQNSLIINLESKKSKRQTEINLGSLTESSIRTILTNAYRLGYDKIRISFQDKRALGNINNTIKNNLIGFEIIRKTEKSCEIENITEPTGQKYDIMLKKIFLIIKETQKIIDEDLKKATYRNWEEIEEMKKSQDKFILFCRRTLTKEMYEKNITLEWELLTFLMHIEHTYFYLYEYAKENKVKVDKSLSVLIEEQKQQFSLYEDAYFNNSLESIYKILKQKNKFQFGKCISLIEKSKTKNSVIASYIRELFRLIQIGCSPILAKNLSY